MRDTALAFPAPALPPWLDGPVAPGVHLRPAAARDLDPMHDWYAESRAAELAAVPWPADARRAFCDSQFALQHRHYCTRFDPAAFLVIERHDAPVGRLYLHWSPAGLHIIDLLLQASARGQGIGSAILCWLQGVLPPAGTLTLHVDAHNADALRLYRRLGFQQRGREGLGLRMAWAASARLS